MIPRYILYAKSGTIFSIFLGNPSVEKKAALVRGEVGEVVDVCDLSSFHRIALLR